MVQSALLVLALAAAISNVNGAPAIISKRIAQNIPDSMTDWQNACLAAGGGLQCNPLAVQSFETLLAGAGPCDQQNSADDQIDLAKNLNNNAKMIQLTQVFVQQPRNSPNSVGMPYCQQAPRNSELNGLFQCQFQGANLNEFQVQSIATVGGLKVGDPGTIPFGHTSPVSPAGSCAAHPSGPIAAGTQLVAITQNPGVASGSSGSAPKAAAPAKATTAAAKATEAAKPATAASTPAAAAPASGFALSNGQAAQALNAKFASLTADSECTSGDEACIGGGFAQCVNGKFVVTSCGTLQCVALPLVNKPGTSIACDTQADAEARIAATGATGGLTGNGAAAASSPAAAATVQAAASTPAASSSSSSSSSSGDFHVANGQAAQALNKKFESLNASSSCTDGEEACIGGGFAQCTNGKFVITQCGASLQCVALPLVNKPGTSITCDTEADAVARIQQSGATGGLTG